MEFAEKRLRIFDALLSRGGLQQLLDAAEDVLENPVVLFDTGMAAVAASSGVPNDSIWSPEAPDSAKRPNYSNAAAFSNYRIMVGGDRPIMMTHPAYGRRCLSARVRRGDAVLGTVLVLEESRSFSPEDERLLPDICQAIGYDASLWRNFEQISERYGRLFADILDGRLEDPREMETRAKLASIELPSWMQLVVARYVRDDNAVSAKYLRGVMCRYFSDDMAVVYGENVVCVSGTRVGDLEGVVGADPVLSSACFGVSLPFGHASGMRRAYDQAVAAIRLSIAGNPSQKVFWYERAMARHLLECASRTCDPRTFEHPALELLARADERDGTERLSDLEAYLSCSRNAALTAKKLHVHKNTMYYRLQRIEEIAGVDLSNEDTCFALQLGLAMWDGGDPFKNPSATN